MICRAYEANYWSAQGVSGRCGERMCRKDAKASLWKNASVKKGKRRAMVGQEGDGVKGAVRVWEGQCR